jgi:gamma-glutamyltranspeptidase / glutathione hydrolase
MQMLKMLERFPIGDAQPGLRLRLGQATLNVMAEAMRIAFADRAVWMGDKDFVPVPTRACSDPTTSRCAARPSPGAAAPNPAADDPRPYETAGLEPATRLAVAEPETGPGENGTTHFSVVDKWGNVVSYTNTIESSHGIGVFAGYRRLGRRLLRATTASCSTTS